MKLIKKIFFLCCLFVSSFMLVSAAHAICGDGVRDAGEECDDGNNADGDSCPSNCRPSCGDGQRNPSEQCDDGNNRAGDGCNPICQTETCGNGRVDPPGEECDDGNRNDLDSCTNACTSRTPCAPRGKVEACSGYVSQDYDDFGTIYEDACVNWNRVCKGDAGWGPCSLADISEPSQLPSECIVIECDPNLGIIESYVQAGKILGASADGCSREECDGQGGVREVVLTPSAGAPATCFCGNGIVGDYPGEECDDGNIVDGDGCNALCRREAREICDGRDNDGDRLVDEGFPDTDGDGIADCVDSETCDGKDNDGDTLIDEGFPDSDGDGVKDCLDICAGGDDRSDADQDGKPDFCDPELCNGIDDNGVNGTDEGFPDADQDGVADCVDSEICDGRDNDGDGQIDEGFPDTDRDGVANCVDSEICDGLDNDGDGLVDEGFPDSDRDGTADCRDSEVCDGLDNDGDGLVDEGFPDADNDGTADCRDSETCDGRDNDGDGLVDEGFPDSDRDGIADCRDKEVCDGLDNDGDGLVDEGFRDTDGDGIKNCLDICPGGDDRADADKDGKPNFCDPEICNGIDDNGVSGADEGFPDRDGDHVGDSCDLELCGNGIKEGSEVCDDGNSNDSDSCRNSCTLRDVVPVNLCGDGIVAGNEECDDNNLIEGDGCSGLCAIEVPENPDVPEVPENPDGDGVTEPSPEPIPDVTQGDCLSAGGRWTPNVATVLDSGHADNNINEIVFDATEVTGVCSIAGAKFIGSAACKISFEESTGLIKNCWGYLFLVLLLLMPLLLTRWKLRLDE